MIRALLLALVLSGCCKKAYLPPAPSLTEAPTPRPVIERVSPQHPEAYRCFTRDGIWDLVEYLNKLRVYSDKAWTKCGKKEKP